MKQNLKKVLGKTFVERPNSTCVEFDGRSFTRGEIAELLVPYATPASAIRAIRLVKRYHLTTWRQLLTANLEGCARIRGIGEGSLWALIMLLDQQFGPDAVTGFLNNTSVTWATAQRRAAIRSRKRKQPAP